MFSKLKVPVKLGILAILFLVAMIVAGTQFYSKVTQLEIEPAEKALVGIDLNRKVVDVQTNFTNYYLAYQSKSPDLASTGDAAIESYNNLKSALEAEFGQEGAEVVLAPLSAFGFLQGAKNAESIDSSLGAEFATFLRGCGPVAESIAQKTYLFQNPENRVTTAIEKVYGDLLPASAAVAIAVGAQGASSGGGDSLDDDLGDDDLGGDFEDLESTATSNGDSLAQVAAYGSRFEGFVNQITTDYKGNNVVLNGVKGLDLPLFSNFNGQKSEAEGLIKATGTYLTEFHKLLEQDAEKRLSSAKTTRLLYVLVALAIGVVGTVGFYLISQDIVMGVEKALGVARAISREGDLTLGSRYSSKRGDELGDLLDEMAHMCESLNNTATAAESIASGDLLAASIAPRSGQDRMGKALQNMVDSLRDQIGETKSNAASVAETAKNILAATSQVAATANQMATSISEATTTAEEVRQTANLAEQKAKSVAQSAGEAASVSVVGQRQTQMTLDEMDKIRNQMETIAESIVRLSEQGQAIGDIITTVNDIAEQSNVLAVNASIEAAKAGEHGRGFAVVAQEVKSLADESKTATSAIRAILSDIERATAAAVMLAEQGTKSAQASVDRSKEAGSSIKDLGTRVVQAAQSSAQISASASQQLAGVDQVVDAMISIKDGSSQIVDSVNMVKNAAEELSGLSATLQKNIQTYKV